MAWQDQLHENMEVFDEGGNRIGIVVKREASFYYNDRPIEDRYISRVESGRLHLTPDARRYYDTELRESSGVSMSATGQSDGPANLDPATPSVETSAPERNPAGYDAAEPSNVS